ncbi:hypothetical protein ACFVDU_22845 [Streptomyces albidoflavus]
MNRVTGPGCAGPAGPARRTPTACAPPRAICSAYGELGASTEWNAGKAADQGEFAKPSVPYAEAKPGKLAYALRYEEAHGIG